MSLGAAEPAGWMRGLRLVFALALSVALIYFGVFSLRWPMMVNAPVMHYVNFLLRRGMQPYSQITDMNLPGAYLLERFGMTVFGAGDLGWRLYDFALAAVLTWSMVVIAAPEDWLGGYFAGGLFTLRHISEGPWFSGERELEMAVLLVAATALLFTAVRRVRPGFALPFGLLAGMAASVKPTLAPFGLLALLLGVYAMRTERRRAGRLLAYGLAGMLLAAGISLAFLAAHHAFAGFAFVLRRVVPAYLQLNDPGRRALLRNAVPPEWLALLALAVATALVNRRWHWEKAVLLLGGLCGLLSYVAQGKGFWYQRYIYLAFGMVLLGTELFPRQKSRATRWLGAAALLWASVVVLPSATRLLRQDPGRSDLTLAMESDLRQLGGERLQGRVQCFDMTFGCLNSLYHLRLVENTGFTGDMLLFPAAPNPIAVHYQDLFWQAQAVQPAEVLVLTNQEFAAGNSFNRFARWPQFQQYLLRDYAVAVQRSFPREDKYKDQPSAPPATAPAYALYVRKKDAEPVATLLQEEGR